MPNYGRTKIVNQQKGQTVGTRLPPKKTGVSDLYQQYLNQRASLQASADQARAKAIADAQRKKLQAEQKAFETAQANAQAQADADARTKRQQALTERRMTRRSMHQVSRDDTPESIATQYGTTPQDVVKNSGVSKLVAGQVIPVYQTFRQKAEDLMPRTLTTAEKKAEDTGIGGQPQALPATMGANELRNLQIEERNMRLGDAQLMQYYTNNPQAINPEDANLVNQILRNGGYRAGERITEQDIWQMNETADAYTARVARDANYARYLGNRWTGQAVDYVYKMALETGDVMTARRTLMGTKFNPETGRYEPDETKWMVFPLEEFKQLETITQQQLDAMGWRYNEVTGMVEPVLLEEPDYGMGGYTYPDLGGYGYGGGGGYTPEEPKPRTGTRLGYESGGRARGRSGQLYAGSVPPAHWRI